MKELKLLTPENIINLPHYIQGSFVWEQRGRFENLEGAFDDYKGFPKDEGSTLFYLHGQLESMIFRNFIKEYTNYISVRLLDCEEDGEYCVLVNIPFEDKIKDKKGNIIYRH